jgi:hypothetical protein
MLCKSGSGPLIPFDDLNLVKTDNDETEKDRKKYHHGAEALAMGGLDRMRH